MGKTAFNQILRTLKDHTYPNRLTTKPPNRPEAPRREQNGNEAADFVLSRFPAFAPYGGGSQRNILLELTVDAANQTAQLLLDLCANKIPAAIQIETFAKTEEQKAAAGRLAELFNHYGSDKADSFHCYHHLYGAILERPLSISAIAEIGLGTNNEAKVSNMGKDGKPGASLRAFRDFAPNAQILGADIDRDILFTESRITTAFVDQTNPHTLEVLSRLMLPCDLIVDDGLHAPHANLNTLSFALKHLKPGGWAVIEDIRHEALPIWKIAAVLFAPGYEPYIFEAPCGYVFAAQRRS